LGKNSNASCVSRSKYGFVGSINLKYDHLALIQS
jgi:hypothetical protein